MAYGSSRGGSTGYSTTQSHRYRARVQRYGGTKTRGAQRRARAMGKRIRLGRRQRAERRELRRKGTRQYGTSRTEAFRQRMRFRHRGERRTLLASRRTQARRARRAGPIGRTRVSPPSRFKPVGARGVASYWGRRLGFGRRTRGSITPSRGTSPIRSARILTERRYSQLRRLGKTEGYE